MTITVAESKKAWTSPDGKISIWDIKTDEGMEFPTFSHKIGNGIGQSFDVVTDVRKGKTYIKQAPDPNSPYADQQQPQAPQAPQQGNSASVEKFSAAVDKFAAAVEKLASATGAKAETPPNDDRPPLTDQDVAEFMGGEVVDDV